jgi:hypothetical protein
MKAVELDMRVEASRERLHNLLAHKRFSAMG